MTDSTRVPGALQRAVARLERSRGVDPVAGGISAVAARVVRGRAAPVLRGEWLGHALHPLATDFPLGCWLAAGFLDLTCRRGDRPAAQRLVGIGLLCSIPTAATGLAEYATIRDGRSRRVGAVHAVGNVGVLGCYAMSWTARRRGHHARAVVLATLGGSAACVTGYLGGHLSFARHVGSGERGMNLDAAADAAAHGAGTWSPPNPDDDEALLVSGVEPVWATDGEQRLARPSSP